MRTTNVRAASLFPAASAAKKLTVVTPSAAIVTAPAAASVPSPDCAPLSVYLMTSTPDPLSAAAKVRTTSRLFQPAALGGVDRIALVTGGVESMRTTSVRADSALPARSLAKYVSVVSPSAKIVIAPFEDSVPLP